MAEPGREKASSGATRSRGRWLGLVAGAVVAIALSGAAAAYFLGLLPGLSDAGNAAHAAHEEAGEHPAAGTEGSDSRRRGAGSQPVVFVDLPEILVNLQPDGNRMRFLRLRIALEVEGEQAAAGVKNLTPRVLDSFQMYLRALTVEEVQGSVGMQRLKEEMIARVNLSIEPSRIRDVLFKEILVQ